MSWERFSKHLIIQFCIFLMYTNPWFFQDFVQKNQAKIKQKSSKNQAKNKQKISKNQAKQIYEIQGTVPSVRTCSARTAAWGASRMPPGVGESFPAAYAWVAQDRIGIDSATLKFRRKS